MTTRFILVIIFALPILAGLYAAAGMTDIAGGFGGWQAAMVINTALAAAIFAVALIKSRKA